MLNQNTIKNTISFKGLGLHSGVEVDIRILPAPEDTGIIFKRVDINKSYDNEIKALYGNVLDTRLGTTIGNSYGVVVQTIEHFMASLWAFNIDNAIIEINNKEVPIMDGSADMFIKEIKKAGIKEQKEERKYLKILKPVEVTNGDSYIKLLPAKDYKIEINIDFPYGGIGKQSIIFDGNPEFFTHEIAKARTFCNEKEIDFMKKNGLALGGSLDNAMVFNEKELINKEGFRCDKEVVKHKLLDCVGDMFTSGYFISCHIEANKSGHTLNNEVLRKVFSDRANYSLD